ncbi:hypothetical protein ACFGYI_04205 [Pasteurella multocida]
MVSVIIISALTSIVVSLLVHWFTVTQVTKWFDGFFNEQEQIMKKYADDVKDIIISTGFIVTRPRKLEKHLNLIS